MGLDSDIQDILELDNKSSSAQSKAFKKLGQLREKIKNGESTGDIIKDFVIANHGTLSSDAEKPYRETEARLKKNIGNQVLVIKQSESIHGCPGIVAPDYIRPEFIGINTDLRLGVLTSGLELDIKEGKIILPTKRHSKKYDNGSSRNKWKLEEGPISIEIYEFQNLDKKLQRRTTPIPNDLSAHFEHSLMIHLGEEVEQYFNREQYFSGNMHLDLSYVEALDLLGHKAPEKFRKKYNENIYQKRIGIINKLEELTGEELKLNSNTNQKINKEIQGYLRQAIELEMHKKDLRIEQKPGIEINVPTYISRMCEKYEVELPK